MNHQFLKHPDEERIEAYVLGRLAGQQAGIEDGPELAAIENHFLVCHECVLAAESFEETAEGVRYALGLKKPRRMPKPRTLTAGQSFI
jgi:hypothetical protein